MVCLSLDGPPAVGDTKPSVSQVGAGRRLPADPIADSSNSFETNKSSKHKMRKILFKHAFESRIA